MSVKYITLWTIHLPLISLHPCSLLGSSVSSPALGTFCGSLSSTSHPPTDTSLVASGQNLFIGFHSDAIQEGTGFKAHVFQVGESLYYAVLIHFTLQAGPFSISSQSTKLTAQCEIRKLWTELTTLWACIVRNNIPMMWGSMWTCQWCLWPPKLGGNRILLAKIDFDTFLILIGTLYSTCIWLFLSDF